MFQISTRAEETELLSTDKSNQQDYCKTPKPGNAAEFQLELVSKSYTAVN